MVRPEGFLGFVRQGQRSRLLPGRSLDAEVRIRRGVGIGRRGNRAADWADSRSGHGSSLQSCDSRGRCSDLHGWGSASGARDEGLGRNGRGECTSHGVTVNRDREPWVGASGVGSSLHLLADRLGRRLVQLVVVDIGQGIVLTDFLVAGTADLALAGASSAGARSGGTGATTATRGCGNGLGTALSGSSRSRTFLGSLYDAGGVLAVVNCSPQGVGIFLDAPELELDAIGSALSEILGDFCGDVELANDRYNKVKQIS